jgi:hypothetical protein
MKECHGHWIVPIIYRLSTRSMGGHRICAGMAIKTNTLDRALRARWCERHNGTIGL